MKLTKPAEIAPRLDRPDDQVRLFLLHGPDEAGAAALVDRLRRAMGEQAERVDLDGPTLRSNPGRLAEEAASLSLFGDRRWIRVTGAGEESLAAADQLLGIEKAGNPAVMIAPGVKTSGKLVKLCQTHGKAIAYGCYIPDAAAATRIAADLAKAEGLRLDPRAAQRLAVASGGDRSVMAREIEKLALYLDASPDHPVDARLDALAAIGADLEEHEVGHLVDAMLDGNLPVLGADLTRFEAEGISGIAVTRAAVRRLTDLAQMRQQVDRGAGVKDAVEAARIHFKEQEKVTRQLRRWTSPRIAEAIVRLQSAERAMKSSGNVGDLLGAEALIRIAADGTQLR
ncbi:DNA polymerase III subunit delta [Sphingomonas sp. FW199]|uniref:DNA polymerase III subunit delta n=1 Tax=Sphingomonas sp. FW199 TaxID=3400217 RepID=UPI003CE70BF5